jgi:hypothetical protein
VEKASDRQQEIREIDREGIAATPANSRYNEQVIEAARQSILNGGSTVSIGNRTAEVENEKTRPGRPGSGV